MTNIKQVSDWALTIAAEAAGSKLHHYERMADDNRLAQSIEAHARAIEQHEAFKQEVSDAVVAAKAYYEVPMYDLSAFIIAKPDPLVEAWNDMFPRGDCGNCVDVEMLRAAIEKRGGRIVFDGSGA